MSYKGERNAQGQMHGKGTYTYADGGTFKGEYKNGKHHGQGTFTFANGNVSKGQFKDGKRHGPGTYTWSDGRSYRGEYKDDQRHGQGVYTFADGSVYKGVWKENNKHGRGTFTGANGGTLPVLAEFNKFLNSEGECEEADPENLRRALERSLRGEGPLPLGEAFLTDSSDATSAEKEDAEIPETAELKRQLDEVKKQLDDATREKEDEIKRQLDEATAAHVASTEKADAEAAYLKRQLDEATAAHAATAEKADHEAYYLKRRLEEEAAAHAATIEKDEAAITELKSQIPPPQRYTVDFTSKLGVAGQGTVYKGFDNVSEKPVAVKVQPGGDLGAEFELLATLKHQNIVEALHFDDGAADAGLPTSKIFLEFVEGGSVDKCISPDTPLPEEEIRRHLSSVLEALAYIHSQEPPVWHRDIQPAHMLLTNDGTLKLTDFGSGKAQSKTGQTTTAVGGTWVKAQDKTWVYMAPEACEGQPCAASDVWSLACSVIEMASGKKPWHETGLQGCDNNLGSHISMSNPPLNHYPTIPRWLSAPLQSMLKKMFAHNPDDRGTAASHLEDSYFSDEIPTSPPPTAGGESVSAFPQWLMDIEVEDEERNILIDNRVDEKNLLLLDKDDLKEMGIAIGPRKAILTEIEKRNNAGANWEKLKGSVLANVVRSKK